MRLFDFLSLSNLDEKTNKFRAINVGLVKKPTVYNSIVSDVLQKYDIVNELDKEIEHLNKNLQSSYRGKLKFDYCLEEGIDMNKSRIKSRLLKKLKLQLLETNDSLSKVKKEIERKSKNLPPASNTEQPFT
jgi:hypothetical protein